MATFEATDGLDGDDEIIRVLLVDDEPGLAETAGAYLEREDESLTTLSATSGDEALLLLEETTIDAVISDYDMPDMNGLELLDAVRCESPDIPFILFTGKGSEEIASEAISAGVTDYLQKQSGTEQYELLANRVLNAVSNVQTQDALAEQERWYRGLIDASIDVLSVLDREGTFTYVSPAIEDVLGYDPDVVVGTNAFDRVHPDDREQVWEQFQGLYAESGDVEVAEFRYRAADGDWQWLEARGINRLDDPIIEGIVVNVRDIGDRKAHERELERYETIVETVGDAIYTLDETGHFTAVNDYFVQQSGYSRDELIGAHVSTLLSAADIEEGAALIEELHADPDKDVAHQEVIVETASGASIPIDLRIALLPGQDTAFRGTVGIAREITERKRRERDLERQNERLQEYETLVETVPDGVCQLDDEGRMVHVNAEWAAMVGQPKATLEGASLEELVEEGIIPERIVDEYLDLVRDLLSSDTDRKRGMLSARVVPPGETEEHVYEAHVALLPYVDDFQGCGVVVRDVTEKDRHRQELQRQNERLEDFASVVSHDLRNPLSIAKGQVDMAAADHESEHLETAARALDRMDQLTADLLALARQGETVENPETVSLSAVVQEAWAGVSGDGDLHVDVGVATVQADPDRLGQVFQNLFENALAHAGSGVTIRVGCLEDAAGFYVEDDGPGIPDGERERVFERAYTTSTTGTGFGLAIVESIVAAHEWTIDVTEGVDGGARFEISGVRIDA